MLLVLVYQLANCYGLKQSPKTGILNRVGKKLRLMKVSILSFLLFSCLFAFSNTSSTPSSLESVSKNSKTYNSLLEFFNSYDTTLLKSGDESVIVDYLKEKNIQIISYLQQNYRQFGSLENIDPESPDVQIFGYYYAIMEANNFQPYDVSEAGRMAIPGWLACAVDVIGAGSGIYELISGAAFESYGAAWALIKRLVKRYVGWLGVAYTLYEIATDCF